jgi:hypothetical protein
MLVPFYLFFFLPIHLFALAIVVEEGKGIGGIGEDTRGERIVDGEEKTA